MKIVASVIFKMGVTGHNLIQSLLKGNHSLQEQNEKKWETFFYTSTHLPDHWIFWVYMCFGRLQNGQNCQFICQLGVKWFQMLFVDDKNVFSSLDFVHISTKTIFSTPTSLVSRQATQILPSLSSQKNSTLLEQPTSPLSSPCKNWGISLCTLCTSYLKDSTG